MFETKGDRAMPGDVLETENSQLKHRVEQLEKALRKVAELGLFVQTQPVNERRLEVTALLRKVANGQFDFDALRESDTREEGKPTDLIDDTETTTNRT
jgi:hypothetical protein